ncbi:hypothetical protein FE257_009519 [Aspergillus nanangensis]|uniref:Expansin-like EG45 domain-containing protein n=1 Tax=Aspergillus nanangensis TaxID=2582783 RepID=A0AAD4CJT9_ASPNN|nr:hypothetical protein FE257_009519 [Aspergillus nanangensis]
MKLSTIILPSMATIVMAQMKATFTEYGSGDANGSPNCATTVNACGNPTQSGITAALSQQQFGVGPNEGAGPACGTCWELTVTSDLSGNSVSQNTAKVTVNNLCPIDGNPICNVPNQYGAEIHFDLCIDTGASSFLTFGGAGIGTAQQVSC